MKAIAIVSGGLDSVTLAQMLASQGIELHILSFDYGQRHKRELQFAALCAARIHARHDVIDLTSVGKLLTNSSLTGQSQIPDGHYAEESMKSTVVPNRNAIMLSVAVGVAVSEGTPAVAYAAHGGDHFIYPDCRPDFVEAFDRMAKAGNDGFGDITIDAPFLTKSKADIVAIGDQLGVPFRDTWSCYKGGEIQCGRCGTCVERKEAFRLAAISDPTEYVDAEYLVVANR